MHPTNATAHPCRICTTNCKQLEKISRSWFASLPKFFCRGSLRGSPHGHFRHGFADPWSRHATPRNPQRSQQPLPSPRDLRPYDFHLFAGPPWPSPVPSREGDGYLAKLPCVQAPQRGRHARTAWHPRCVGLLLTRPRPFLQTGRTRVGARNGHRAGARQGRCQTRTLSTGGKGLEDGRTSDGASGFGGRLAGPGERGLCLACAAKSSPPSMAPGRR